MIRTFDQSLYLTFDIVIHLADSMQINSCNNDNYPHLNITINIIRLVLGTGCLIVLLIIWCWFRLMKGVQIKPTPFLASIDHWTRTTITEIGHRRTRMALAIRAQYGHRQTICSCNCCKWDVPFYLNTRLFAYQSLMSSVLGIFLSP